jgi:DNA-binding MurR/RpiR family transcriptional regulator
MKAPGDIDQLRTAIVARHDSLSPRLKQVAAYVLDHPNDMGLETLAVIAKRCGVQASTIVRFAKAFGYEGASQMQRLFRDELINSAPSPSYAERIRQFKRQSGDGRALTSHELMREFANSNIIALEHLQETIDGRALERAVDLMEQASAVYLVGLRRSFPVAAYMAYALRHVEKPVHLIDGLAGMLVEQSSMISGDDLLFAISFHPLREGNRRHCSRRESRRGTHHSDQRQPAEPGFPRGRYFVRYQGRRSAPVSLADRLPVPGADAGNQLCAPH